MQRRREIVAAADVRDLVRENRFDLLVAQALRDAARPQQHRAQNAEHAWLEEVSDETMAIGVRRRRRARAGEESSSSRPSSTARSALDGRRDAAPAHRPLRSITRAACKPDRRQHRRSARPQRTARPTPGRAVAALARETADENGWLTVSTTAPFGDAARRGDRQLNWLPRATSAANGTRNFTDAASQSQ